MKWFELYEYTQTKDGKLIEFKYFENIENENRGYRIDEIKAYIDSKEVGYIKVSYIPLENFEKFYPSIFNFIAQIIGWTDLFGIDNETKKWQSLDDEHLKKFVHALYFRMEHVELKYSKNMNFNELPRSELIKLLNKITPQVNKKFKETFNRFIKYNVDRPIVDYIRVDDNYKRRGIGQSLYVAMARWLSERGLKLHASGLQSNDAEKSWNNMEKNNWVDSDPDFDPKIKMINRSLNVDRIPQ